MILFPYIPLIISDESGIYCLDLKTDEHISLEEYYKRHRESGWFGLYYYKSREELSKLMLDYEQNKSS
jgi:hypothetical protein